MDDVPGRSVAPSPLERRGERDPIRPEGTDPLRVLLGIVLALLLAVLVGYILVVGQALILPIVIAVIVVYILVTMSQWIARQPGGRLVPGWLRQVLVIAAFMLALVLLGGVIASTATQLAQRLPVYQANLAALVESTAASLGFQVAPDISAAWSSLTAGISLDALALQALGSFASIGGLLFMVAIYAGFLMGERAGFAAKLAAALPGEGAERTALLVSEINGTIGTYLAVKTLINAILGLMSFVILWAFGIDFAVFWAVLIALLNYIPYVGSYVAVSLPVMLSLAQFGSFPVTIALTLLLVAAQILVGNILEPRMIGQRVNMSPFVVLVAVSVWSALWGISGAILAVPLTSILVIVLAAFVPTRPFAILVANDVDTFKETE
jgi:AI-2 transport protein TqsA